MPPKPRQGGFRGGNGAPGGQGRPGGPPPNASSGATPPPQPGAGGSGGRPMPKSLTADQVSLIRAWVDQGAK